MEPEFLKNCSHLDVHVIWGTMYVFLLRLETDQ